MLDARRHLTDRLAAQLDALSPLRVLGRGYAVPMADDGRVLKRRADFIKDETFRLRVADGDVPGPVEDRDARLTPAIAAAGARARPAGGDRAQAGGG